MFIFDNTANWSATLNKSTTCVDPDANVAPADAVTKFGADGLRLGVVRRDDDCEARQAQAGLESDEGCHESPI